MQEVLVNRLGGLSLPKKSVVRLTDRPEMTLDLYRGRKTTTQQQQQHMSRKVTLDWQLYMEELIASLIMLTVYWLKLLEKKNTTFLYLKKSMVFVAFFGKYMTQESMIKFQKALFK